MKRCFLADSLSMKGFTLIEVVVTSALVAIMATMGIAQFSALKENVGRSETLVQSRNLYTAAETIHGELSAFDAENKSCSFTNQVGAEEIGALSGSCIGGIDYTQYLSLMTFLQKDNSVMFLMTVSDLDSGGGDLSFISVDVCSPRVRASQNVYNNFCVFIGSSSGCFDSWLPSQVDSSQYFCNIAHS